MHIYNRNINRYIIPLYLYHIIANVSYSWHSYDRHPGTWHYSLLEMNIDLIHMPPKLGGKPLHPTPATILQLICYTAIRCSIFSSKRGVFGRMKPYRKFESWSLTWVVLSLHDGSGRPMSSTNPNHRNLQVPYGGLLSFSAWTLRDSQELHLHYQPRTPQHQHLWISLAYGTKLGKTTCGRKHTSRFKTSTYIWFYQKNPCVSKQETKGVWGILPLRHLQRWCKFTASMETPDSEWPTIIPVVTTVTTPESGVVSSIAFNSSCRF